jgi:GNAT superfamily N-acetyltransferase
MFRDMHPDTDYSAIRDALISGSEDYYRRHASDPQCIIVVAQAGVGLVGCAGLIVEEKPPHAKRLRNISGYVLSVYIEAEYRGRGIARALMERIREEAIARGVTRMALHASGFGLPLYRSLGYAPNPTYLELDLPGGP